MAECPESFVPRIPVVDRVPGPEFGQMPGHKLHRRSSDAAGSKRKAVTLILWGAILGALLGFAQPTTAKTPDNQSSQLSTPAYAQLRDSVRSTDAEAPNLRVMRGRHS